tara:strand:+ start:1067 stop:1429 length:363 start_codon:yes stop_codon:yes gene_type:complete
MGIIDTHKEKRQALAELQRELEKLEQTNEFRSELAFRESLDKLIAECGLTKEEALAVVAPKESVASNQAVRAKVTRRTIKRLVRNPHTGEEVMAATRANPTVKGWIKKYGKEKVDSWFIG